MAVNYYFVFFQSLRFTSLTDDVELERSIVDFLVGSAQHRLDAIDKVIGVLETMNTCCCEIYRIKTGFFPELRVEKSTKEVRWDETRFGVKQWQVIRAVVSTTQYFMTHAARHCFTPNRVSSHLTSLILFCPAVFVHFLDPPRRSSP